MSDWQHDPFFQYPFTEFESSAGRARLPILYFDNSVCMGIFLVDYAKAVKLVKSPRLSVVPLTPDKALVGVSFYEYRDTAIQSYNEVGVAVLTYPTGATRPRLPLLKLLGSTDKHNMGFHIIDLPVTTPLANALGREVWGLPKFVTPIHFDLKCRAFSGQVDDPNGAAPIVSFKGKCRFSLPGPLFDLTLLSMHHDQLLRTQVITRGGARLMPGLRFRLTVNPASQHPMAERLRALGLANARPLLVSVSDKLQLRLHEGAQVPVGN